MAFDPRFIGVTRRRFGVSSPDLSAQLDGVPAATGEELIMRKTRTPRRLKVLPDATRRGFFARF